MFVEISWVKCKFLEYRRIDVSEGLDMNKRLAAHVSVLFVIKGHTFVEDGRLKSLQKRTREEGRGGFLAFFLLLQWQDEKLNKPSWKIIKFSPVNQRRVITFTSPFYFAQLFVLFLCTVHYFLCTFSAKIVTYSLVIDNARFVISS